MAEIMLLDILIFPLYLKKMVWNVFLFMIIYLFYDFKPVFCEIQLVFVWSKVFFKIYFEDIFIFFVTLTFLSEEWIQCKIYFAISSQRIP